MNTPPDAQFPPLATLLPHAAPMILLDEVLAYHAEGVTCSLTLRDDAPFVAGDVVPTVVALEYMAQAAGVFAGLEARASAKATPWGFLIGCSELTLDTDEIPVGCQMRIAATRTWGDANLGQFECHVEDTHGTPIARATISVATAKPSDLIP